MTLDARCEMLPPGSACDDEGKLGVCEGGHCRDDLCTPYIAAGAACQSGDRCVPGYRCSENTCAARCEP